MSEAASTTLIYVCGLVSVGYSGFLLKKIASTKLEAYVPNQGGGYQLEEGARKVTELTRLNAESTATSREQTSKLAEIHSAIEVGAKAFLAEEYAICGKFIAAFTVLLFAVIWWAQKSVIEAIFTALSFLCGSGTSMLSGYVGMRVAVFSNVRTTINCQKSGFEQGFNTAFGAGAAVGLFLTATGVLVLYTAMLLYRLFFAEVADTFVLMNCIAAYGLGGSMIAMFGRVGGGIYTKAADVGADMVGKVVHDIPEDDPRNPAVIADLVGDNVGDIAGMGADLFGSFAESTCAALVIAAQSPELVAAGWGALSFPILISSAGTVVALFCSLIPEYIIPVRDIEGIDRALRIQIGVSSVVMLPIIYLLAYFFLPAEFVIEGISSKVTVAWWGAATCVAVGTIGGLLTGGMTEYYTSYSFKPVIDLARAATTGTATEVINGLSLGYKSSVPPALVLAVVIFVAFFTGDLYGISLAAVGMLGALATCLAIDSFGPVCDNAGGIAEMAELPPEVREKTDALDAAGNTTAAIGKGFAIGSAALVSLALFAAFITRIRAKQTLIGGEDAELLTVDILNPLTFAFLVVGACMPYYFSGLTMRSVGDAAMDMIKEVQRQFNQFPDILKPGSTTKPDYYTCVQISTRASLKEMIAPGALTILSPLVVGAIFGVNAVSGLLVGNLLVAINMASSMSNSGGAFDNAKKFVAASDKSSEFGGKGSEVYKSAVVCDTVGDPMKDTSGPSLNILMKLTAILSLIFAEVFFAINMGRGALNIPLH
jgi:inorganic pyrophosphatase